MPQRYKVTFMPANERVEVEDGISLLEAAVQAGVGITSDCGGEGVCKRCKVLVSDGDGAFETEEPLITERLDDTDYHPVLACQTYVHGDLNVFVPESARITEYKILTLKDTEKVHEVAHPLRTIFLELPPPTLNDNLSDYERLKRWLNAFGVKNLIMDLELMQDMGHVLRDADWKVTATVLEHWNHYHLISLDPGDKTEELYGVAVDIGTTTVVATLIDLKTGKVLDQHSNYNKQMVYGEDVLSRITYSQEKGGLERLNTLVIETVNYLVDKMAKGKKDRTMIVVAAGNTTMTHLLLDINPNTIRTEPYIPAANIFPPVSASRLGLTVNPRALLHCLPCRGSYVGGDITADVLAAKMHKKPELALLIDVGTNGEVVLGNNEWLATCSCSAGPAFEGGEIEFGMRATSGAIERLTFLDEDKIWYQTINDVPPRGICGSGLIDLMAELFIHDIIDRTGNLRNGMGDRIREGNEGKEFVIVPKGEAGIARDIVITEPDIKSIIRTKGAVYSAAAVLMNTMGFTYDDVAKIYIAGGFGNFLDIRKSILIGLFPDVPVEKFELIGNGSLKGAQLVLLSNKAQHEAEEIYNKMTYFELSVNNDFYNEYISALFLPHTQLDLFPNFEEYKQYIIEHPPN